MSALTSRFATLRPSFEPGALRHWFVPPIVIPALVAAVVLILGALRL